jgi:predicted amidophosphoribosyltransferase
MANSQADGIVATSSDVALPACVHCQAERFHFDQVVAKWTYQGRVCDAIVAAKHASHAALGSALGRQLGERVLAETATDPPDQITYVPSHFLRQWSRGGRSGNVAIAEAVNECVRQAIPKVALKPRLRATRRIKKQAWLGDVERRKNVSGAFAAKKGYAWPEKLRNLGATQASPFDIKNQHILVIDDVLTTGATANEVAKVLREAGARRVTLAVVARAVWSK